MFNGIECLSVNEWKKYIIRLDLYNKLTNIFLFLLNREAININNIYLFDK